MARRLNRLLIIGVLVLLVVSLALGGFLFETGAFEVNTNAESLSFAGVSGLGGYDVGDRHEVVPWDKLIASWLADGKGQEVPWSVKVSIADPGNCGNTLGVSGCNRIYIDEVDVNVIIEGPGIPFQLLAPTTRVQRPSSDQWECTTQFPGAFGVPACPETWNVQAGIADLRSPDGKTVIADGTIVTVQATTPHIYWYDGLNSNDKGGALLVIDRVKILTGIGSVRWEGVKGDAAGGIYATVGDTIRACWNVGYVTDQVEGIGWYIHAFSRAQNKVVIPNTAITQLDGCVPYTIASADFIPNGTINQNGIDLFLYNEVNAHDVYMTSVNPVGAEGRIPSCTAESWSPQSPKQGETITLKFRCDPATSDPQDAIKEIEVRWGYGTFDHEVILPAGSTMYSFSVTQSGIVNFALRAITVSGIMSGTQNYKISVDYQPINTCYGSEAFCNPYTPTPLGIPLWLWFVFAGIAALMVAIFIPRGLVGPLIRIIIVLVAGMFFLLAALFYG